MKHRKPRQWLVDAGAIFTALVFLVPVGWVLAEERRLSTHGEIAQAVVLSKETIKGGGDGPTSYYVRYSFNDTSGREYTGSAEVGHSMYDTLSPGGRLQIQYLAEDPGRSRVAAAFNPGILMVVALGGLGVCFFFILGPQRWLRELGGERDPALD